MCFAHGFDFYAQIEFRIVSMCSGLEPNELRSGVELRVPIAHMLNAGLDLVRLKRHFFMKRAELMFGNGINLILNKNPTSHR